MHSFPNLEAIHFSMSGFNCCFLTCIQISQEAGKVVWYSHLLNYFPHLFVIHTVKGFRAVSTTEVGFFFFFFPRTLLLYLLISGSSDFSKSSLNIWKFSVHILSKPCLENMRIILLVCQMNANVR